RFAIFTALNRIGRTQPESWPAIVSALASENQRIREGAEFAMRETYEEQLLNWLARMATNSIAPGPLPAKAAAMRLLISLAHRPSEWKGEWGAYHPALAPPPAKTNRWEGTAPALLAFENVLGSSDPSLRLLAIEGLEQAEDRPRAAASLRGQFAREKEPRVRAALLQLLAQFKDHAFAVRRGSFSAVGSSICGCAIWRRSRFASIAPAADKQFTGNSAGSSGCRGSTPRPKRSP